MQNALLDALVENGNSLAVLLGSRGGVTLAKRFMQRPAETSEPDSCWRDSQRYVFSVCRTRFSAETWLAMINPYLFNEWIKAFLLMVQGAEQNVAIPRRTATHSYSRHTTVSEEML